MPAGPPPTTSTRLRTAAGVIASSASRPLCAFTAQFMLASKGAISIESMQFWHDRQRRISSVRPLSTFAGNSGSASSGRAIATMSASPSAMIFSARTGSWMRPTTITGTFTTLRTAAATAVL